MRWVSRGFAHVAVLAIFAACGHDVSLNTPAAEDSTGQSPDSGNGGGGGGTVQRASLTITVTVAPEDAGLAAAVGSPGGVLSDAFVTIQRQGGAQAKLSDTTDGAGAAAFAGIVPGSYVISAARLLTPEETASFGPTDQDVNAFGGGSVITVTAPETSAQVEVAAGRRGSLVISEVFSAEPLHSGGIGFFYFYGHFIELYNNADTAIPLDGKIIGRGQSWWRDFSSPRSCDEMERWRNDPEGIWTRFLEAFPSGRTLPPGQTVLVATDAIDHSAIVPEMQNLTHANYEFIGSSDVDNPGVPNMIRSGLAEWAPVFGHGQMFSGAITFIAESLTVAALATDDLPVQNPRHVRVPREKLLDVFTTGETPELEAQKSAIGSPLCRQIVHQNFDRQFANLEDTRDPQRSMRRRVFAALPSGRVILLRTRSSRTDFEAARPTPGGVP